MSDVAVYTSPLPFSNKQTKALAAPGSSLQDIVNQAVPAHYWPAGIGARVEINGHMIPRKHWARIKPKMGTTVNVRVVLQGGRGGKNPLATLLSIAVMIAAPYIGAALGTSVGLGVMGTGVLTAGQTAFFNGLITGVVGVVGRMLVSALAPPPKPSNLGQISNPAESPTQFIEGAKNQINPYGVVPVCLGTNRMFPLQAARPYTETQDNNQYVRQLLTYGYGDEVVISDIKVGETSITEFTDFEMQHRLNGDLHEPTDLFSNDVFQEDFSVLISESAGFISRTGQPNADESIIDFTFPRGFCKFNTQGKRTSHRVQLELQTAPAGSGDWSPAVSAFKDFSGASLTLENVRMVSPFKPTTPVYSGSRTDTIVIDKYSGKISVVQGQTGFSKAQPIPENAIRLAAISITQNKDRATGVITTTTTLRDERQPSLFGTVLKDSSSFVVSNVGLSVTVTDGAILVNDLDLLGNQTEALRKSVRIIHPQRGQYDFRYRRITEDSDDDQTFDEVYFTAIKSVTYRSPVALEGLNGTAIRIKATDQLNGALDQLNALVSNVIPDFNDELGGWEPRITSNPAAIYRYVLQGGAMSVPLPDNKINLTDIEDWHRHCVEQGYTYNRVIDYETSVDEILRDVAAAGSASPAIVDGKRTIVIDRVKDDIVQIVTPRNSWGYSGEMIYPDMPHAFRVQFRNEQRGYVQDELIVYDDGYDESNATKFEVLELQSCTNSDLAYTTGRRFLAMAKLRPEIHTFSMDVENLVCLRGDRIKLEHDAPIIGVGDGRIKEVIMGDSPEMVAGIRIDDTVTIPNNGVYYVRIRCADGTQLYKQVITNIGDMTSFDFAEPFPMPTYDINAPALLKGDLCYFVEAGGELDLIITRIEPSSDLTARITAINYAPEIFDAENSAIPPFNSNITVPLEFIRPLPPELINEQSDEEVMLVNSDGTFIPRAVFILHNKNEGAISVTVKVRITGTSTWTNANILETDPEKVVLTGLEDGRRYDIHIRYRRAGSNTLSVPLQLNNYLFIGASGLPSQVQGFRINVVGTTALLKWNPNPEIDISHYIIRYSPVYSGATWGTSLTLEDKVFENRVSVPFQGGTYLIKAVDLSGNESEDAALVITYNPGALENVVEVLQEDPAFLGVPDSDNIVLDGNGIRLNDVSLKTGYYVFSRMVDLDEVFTSFVSANIVANGVVVNNLFDIDDLFQDDDIFGVLAGNNNIFNMADIFMEEDIFGIGSGAWSVSLEYSITMDDSADPLAEWSPWQPLEAGNYEFRAIKFRLKMDSFTDDISPLVRQLSVKIDMPDRIERGEDILCPVGGITITYPTPFKNNPAVAITIQDGDASDEIQIISKSSDAFTLMVYNTALGMYVERTFDYIASGYGRKNL